MTPTVRCDNPYDPDECWCQAPMMVVDLRFTLKAPAEKDLFDNADELTDAIYGGLPGAWFETEGDPLVIASIDALGARRFTGGIYNHPDDLYLESPDEVAPCLCGEPKRNDEPCPYGH